VLEAPPPADLFGLIPMVLGETLVGLAIGVIAAVPLFSLEMAGVVMGHSIGFGLARVYNPEADFDTDILGQLLYYIGAGVFVALGGLEVLLRAVLASFGNVPLGGLGAGAAPLELLTGTIASGMELAVRVAAPVTGIVLLLVIVFGVVGKTMPQVNIMSVGFAIKIMAGLTMLAMAIYAVRNAVGDEVLDVLRSVNTWVRGLSVG
jgi:flagellar biosynthesis protein FliR